MNKIITLLLGLLIYLHAEEENTYKLGNGVQIASLPMYIGGYISMDYYHTDDENRYRIDDIAFLSYGNHNKFSYMLEVEFQELYTITETDGHTVTQNNNRLEIERLYIDYNANANYLLRVGKYNSPIGFWNMLPINILRETTSSPQSTYVIFPTFTTGILTSFSSFKHEEYEIDILLQHNQDLDSNYNNYVVDEHYGFGITYTTKNDLHLKVNAGVFNNIPHNGLASQNLYYALLSAKYENNNFEFIGELGSQRSKHEATTNYAWYTQGLYRFQEKHITVLRVESYDDKMNSNFENIAIIGYTYRPTYPIAIKVEYQFHSNWSKNKFLSSLSVLF